MTEAPITSRRTLHVALLGNPNSGKSSVFNQLTGLHQKVGNFPGVTVEKKVGRLQVGESLDVKLIDFPGTYSLHPNASDERLVLQAFSNPKDPFYPDAIAYIADVTRLEKHLLLFSQLYDLGLPMVLALNMSDLAEQEGRTIHLDPLRKLFDLPVICISGRTGQGLEDLKTAILEVASSGIRPMEEAFYPLGKKESLVAEAVMQTLDLDNPYQALLIAHHCEWLPFLNNGQRTTIRHHREEAGFESVKGQVEETLGRYSQIEPVAHQVIQQGARRESNRSHRIDRILTHRIAGPLIFFLLMMLVFQAIFAWAEYPMDLIEGSITALAQFIRGQLPDGWFTDLLTDGLLAGLGGILVFIPQIAILFFLISLLEEVGYMARAAYMFDSLMQKFGLSGKSIVALISGGACAIPAVMSTRTIANWKERLITILVTPLISCSARIPVYTVLIGFVVPSATVLGIFNLQGLAFMGLYLLGIAAALLSALVFHWILRSRERSFLMLELPEYRPPVMRNVMTTVWNKVKAFTLEAGRVILIISLVLWVLANFGPPGAMDKAQEEGLAQARDRQYDQLESDNLVASRRLEASYAGLLGKSLEPAIAPLGFDWKIGIALITSFAAREVFVGTMATIYSIGSEEDEFRIRDRMAEEVNPDTGKPVYTIATSLSLLLFYVFAMQCMSTLAVVGRETNSWKWPAIQFTFMGAMAYLASLLAFQLLS